MLNSVRHAGHVCLVTEVSNIDVHGSTCFVSFSIVDQQHLKLVWKPHNAVGSIVQRRGLQVICQ
jgi:hypothetical protein